MILSTIFEVSAIILFIIGLLNEKAIIEFEDRLALAIAKRIKKHIRRKMLKKRAAAQKNLRAVSSYKDECVYRRTA